MAKRPEKNDAAKKEPGTAERLRIGDALITGLGAGMLAGLILGVAEAAVVVTQMQPPRDYTVLGWAAVVSGIVWAAIGAGLGVAMWAGARLLRRPASERSRRYAFVAASLVSGFGFVVTWFRLYRDLFHENVRPRDPTGLVTLAILAVCFGALFLLLRWGLRRLTSSRAGRFLLRAWGTPAAACVAALALVAVGLALGEDDAHANGRSDGEAQGRPNIVLVMVDTLRPDHLDLYGYGQETAPNLTAFARDAVTFRNAFAQASWTRPSVATILTGRYPSSHQATTKPDALPDEVETIAEVLRRDGYATHGVVSNFNLAPYFNFHQGFDTYDYLEPEQLLWADDNAAKLTLYELLRRVAARLPLPLRVEQFYQDAEVTTDHALARLAATPADGAPYFLFMSYMDPHDPYFRHPYDGHAIGRSFMPNPDPSRAEEIVGLYDGEIRYWDHHFGRLLAALRQRPDWDRTLVVICSDHGEEFQEHGGWWHGATLYDEQIRVPLIVRLPSSELGGTSDERWVGLIDIAPTATRLAGITVPERMGRGADLFVDDGVSRSMFSEENHEGNRLHSLRYQRDGAEWKYIHANAGNPRGLDEQELYDVRADPGERRNRAGAEVEELGRAQTDLGAARADAARGAAARSSIGLDAGALEQLRNIGYMEDDAPPEPPLREPVNRSTP